MFEFNRRYSFFRRAIVVFFVVPLMFTGGAFLGDLAQQQSVGEVESLDIPRGEYVSRYQSLAERYRRETGEENIPPSAQEAISRRIQSDLLSSYLIFASLEKKGVRAPDGVVAAEIRDNPEFQDEGGDFSLRLYQDAVIDQRDYQERVRRSLGRTPLLRTVGGLPLSALRQEIAELRRQKRIVDEVSAPVGVLTTTALTVSAEEINLYYQRNAAEFFLREEAAFEYFLLSLDAFVGDEEAPAAAVRDAYDDFVEDWDERQRLRVSHIYAEDEQTADELYALVRAAPAAFADLARTRSEDAGSASLGGELGIIAGGDLPDALDAVVTTMRAGQIHPPVAAGGGFSILKLDEIIFDPPPPFAAVKEELELQARRDEARDAFELAAEELSELAPVEIGSLSQMAATVGVTVAVVATVYNNAPEENPAPFNDEVVLVEAFSSPVISAGENSDPIPLGEDAYLFVRTLGYQPPGQRPLLEVEDSIAGRLRAERLAARMYEEILDFPGTTLSLSADAPSSPLLAKLGALTWERTHTVVLAGDEEDDNSLDSSGGDGRGGLLAENEEVPLDLIYIADLSNGLPAYVFEPLENTVRIFRIREVEEGVVQGGDEELISGLLGEMTSQLGYLGYLDELGGQYQFQFYNLPEFDQPTSPTF